ncbi:DUF1365 domain-containing protein [Terrirubrum flagellatum]|uniref:DUF1365 domain-containing protein n=1 Tax=Terrirubrum flagellatum TaxID=2895980 RepID=UPI003CC8364F
MIVSSARFHPPVAAVSLYRGEVMHARLKPFGYRFAYRVATILIDIDRLEEAKKASRLFSVGRFNLYGFDIRDHGKGDGSSLRAHVDEAFAQAGLAEPPTRVLLLCYPRILGRVFDPLSVYFAYDARDELVGVIYEVRNTFGQRHSYIAPVRAGEMSEAGLRQERDKLFHVSPFLPMNLRYRFRLRPPAENVAIRILEIDAQGPVLAATFHGRREKVCAATLVSAFAAIPFLTIKVIVSIHWEALKLWIKGARLFARPIPPAPLSIEGKGAYSDAIGAIASSTSPCGETANAERRAA